ncbi:MAG: peptidylprolyl isomerase [Bacteroidales bacterium]|nr:peptidylprolyl isomerase [Bacteroidales bacterium]
MEAAANKVVSIIYVLKKDGHDGEIVESLNKENPLTFLFGAGNLLPKFEENLMGLKSGDSFAFSLSSDEAYGDVQQNAIVDVPLSVFEVDGKTDTNLLQLGNVIPMMDNEGRRLNGVVKEIHDDTVTMDFNHPMAGASLFFSGEVTEIREATEEELQHGHIHQSCGCGSGGCGDGKGEACDCSDGSCSTDSAGMEGSCGCGTKHEHEHSH